MTVPKVGILWNINYFEAFAQVIVNNKIIGINNILCDQYSEQQCGP